MLLADDLTCMQAPVWPVPKPHCRSASPSPHNVRGSETPSMIPNSALVSRHAPSPFRCHQRQERATLSTFRRCQVGHLKSPAGRRRRPWRSPSRLPHPCAPRRTPRSDWPIGRCCAHLSKLWLLLGALRAHMRGLGWRIRPGFFGGLILVLPGVSGLFEVVCGSTRGLCVGDGLALCLGVFWCFLDVMGCYFGVLHIVGSQCREGDFLFIRNARDVPYH